MNVARSKATRKSASRPASRCKGARLEDLSTKCCRSFRDSA
jgi:hypothetical protein